MLETLKYLLKNEIRSSYPGHFSLLLGFVSTFIMASIYYYTSIALEPNDRFFQNFNGDYFLFVIIAEVCLLAPITAIINFSKFIREYSVTGIFDQLSYNQNSIFKLLTLNVAAAYLIDLLKVLMIFIVVTVFFELNFSFQFLLIFFFSQIVIIPSLLGIGFLSTALILFFGRGGNIIPMMLVVLSVLAGAYFPPEVFPSSLNSLTHLISPFNLILEINRNFFSSQPYSTVQSCIQLLVQGVLYCIFGWLLVQKSVIFLKTKGRNTLITR